VAVASGVADKVGVGVSERVEVGRVRVGIGWLEDEQAATGTISVRRIARRIVA
jgi:hypothetical protein